MSGLGGTILGGAGVGAIGAGGILGGSGVEGFPDGAGGGGEGVTIDFSGGLPAGFISVNTGTPITFTANGGFMEVDPVPYTYPGNGQSIGIYNGDDVYDGLDVDVRMTFAWNASADTNSEAVGPGIFEIQTNALTNPGTLQSLSDRNFNRVQPSRFSLNGGAGNTPMANGANTHGLAGGELTADGSTLHTIGFRIVGTMWTAFFDDVITDGPNLLDAAELAIRAAATRVGVFWSSSNINATTIRILTLELAPQGTIYPVP